VSEHGILLFNESALLSFFGAARIVAPTTMSAARPNAPQVRTTSLMSVALRVPPLLDHLMCSPSILIKLRVLCREWKQKSDSVDLDRFTRATFREKDVWPPDARLLDEFHSFFRCRMRICQLRIERKLCFDGTKETQETSTVAACWSVARAAATLFTPQRIPHQTEFHQEVNNFAIDDLLLRVRRSPELAAVGCHILSRAPRLIEPFIDVCDEGHKCGHSPLNEVGFALQDDASCVRASQLLVAMAIPDCVDTIVTTLCTGKTPGQTGWMARGSPLSDGVRRCLDFVEFGVDSPQSSQSSARSSSEQIRLVAAANVIVWLTALYCLSNDTTVLRAVAALGFAPHLLRLSLPGKVQVHSQIRCLAACLVRTTLHEVLSFAPPGSELHLSESFQHFPDALEDDDGGEALASSPPSLARTRSRPRAPSREHPNRTRFQHCLELLLTGLY